MPQQQAIATEDYLGIPVGRYLAGLDTSGASPRLTVNNYGYWLVTDSVGWSHDPASIDVLAVSYVHVVCFETPMLQSLNML